MIRSWPWFAGASSAGTFLVLVGFWRERGKDVLDVLVPRCNHTSDVNELKRSNKQLQKHIDMITKAMSSDDRMSQLFTQLQSQRESGSGSRSGVGGDDEDADEDVEDADS
ncbi:hypothetical protein Tco_0057328 [Tanacetum coccineum]